MEFKCRLNKKKLTPKNIHTMDSIYYIKALKSTWINKIINDSDTR